MVERVRQEVRIHSRLKHPSILELHTFFEDERAVYLVLELCVHGELGKYVRSKGCLTEVEGEARKVNASLPSVGIGFVAATFLPQVL